MSKILTDVDGKAKPRPQRQRHDDCCRVEIYIIHHEQGQGGYRWQEKFMSPSEV